MRHVFAVLLAAGLALSGCNGDGEGVASGAQGASGALTPQEYAEVYEGVSARLIGVTEGADSREALLKECKEAAADVERRRPQLEGAADDELARRGGRWADALEAYYESCQKVDVDHPDRKAELKRVNDEWAAVAKRMVELGVEPAY